MHVAGSLRYRCLCYIFFMSFIFVWNFCYRFEIYVDDANVECFERGLANVRSNEHKYNDKNIKSFLFRVDFGKNCQQQQQQWQRKQLINK